MRGGLLIDRVAARYRRSGADLPGGDPRPTHGALMEGWFWRFTDRRHGRVVVALCGVNQHADGPWATVAVAVHPGGVVRSAAVDDAEASATSYHVRAGEVLTADELSLRVELDDVRLAVELQDLVAWPLRLGAGGIFSTLPFLGRYGHPHALGGRASGEVVVAGERRPLGGAAVYAEKNWGQGFPDWWWWGQAHGFTDPTLCVAFGGGRLRAGPVAASVTGCVVRAGGRVVRFSPPFSVVRTQVARGSWQVSARRPRWRLELEGDGDGATPATLHVPLPAERRNVDRDFEHLAGRLRVRLWRNGSLYVDDESAVAGLEVGSTDRARATSLREDFVVVTEPPATPS